MSQLSMARRAVASCWRSWQTNGVVSSQSAVQTFASGFVEPLGVAVDRSGNVFVADELRNGIYEIAAGTGTVSRLPGSPGLPFIDVNGVAVDGKGDVFVADIATGVYEITNSNGVFSSPSLVGSSLSTQKPAGVRVDGYGNVFVASKNGTTSEIVAANGVVSSGSQVITLTSGFNNPLGLAVDGNGDVFVADTLNNAVKEIVAGAQKFPTTPVGTTSGALTIYFTFDSPGQLAWTPYVVLTQGAQNFDFQAAATQSTGACVAGQNYNAAMCAR